jgi:ferredoxin
MESAIDWFFENEEMGIILEDDTLPAPSFFRFCSELLVKYKDEEKVFLINGTNEGAKKASANTYTFKRVYDFPEDVNGFWGWASWRRAWKKHDKKMLKLQEYKRQCQLDENALDYDKYLKNTRIRILVNQIELIFAGENNCWDLKFKFTSLINGGLFIIPDCNLVTNIGAGVSDAAHTAFEYSVGTTLITGEVRFPLEHKQQVSPKPLTPKEYLRAAYMPISAEKEFWDMEAEYTDSILNSHNFLATSGLANEQKFELYRNFLRKTLFELITVCTLFKEFSKAQKYLYLALAKSLFYGEKNHCSKCQKHECLSVCPSNSISSYQTDNGEIAVKIDRKTCEYCFNCMKVCNVVKQR